MTAFTDLVGTDLPIIQAPMAGAQRSAMTIAVSMAGGLGSLPCAMLSPEETGAELRAIGAATDRPYNVNFFCHRVEEPDAEAERVWRTTLSPYYAEYGVDPATSHRALVEEPSMRSRWACLRSSGRRWSASISGFRPPTFSTG